MFSNILSRRGGRIAAVATAGALVLGATVGVSTTALADSRSRSSHSRSYGAVPLTTAPVISGIGTVGETLTYVPAVWAVTPDTVSFQWYSGEHKIAGATASTFVITSAQSGKHLSVRETAVKAGYKTRTVASNKIKVGALATMTELQDVVIFGTTTVGSTITIIPGMYNVTPDSVSYQWQRNGVAIAGATNGTYVLTADDLGKQIRVVETVVKAGYKNKAEASNRLWVPTV